MKWKEIVLETGKELPSIDEVKLFAHDRETGYKAVVDKSTMDTICVIPNDYAVIEHGRVLEQIRKLEKYIIKDMRLLQNGQLFMAEVTEREPKKIELLPDDYIECGARITNNYSKDAGLSVQGYATRLVCTNGLTESKRGAKVGIKAFGTPEFSTEIEEKIEQKLNVWTDMSKLFERASKTKIHVKDMLEEHSFLPKKYMDKVIEELKDEETLYNIWNVYTQVITHQIAPNTKTMNTIGLEKRANKILTIGMED